jgi:hypothetical protein
MPSVLSGNKRLLTYLSGIAIAYALLALPVQAADAPDDTTRMRMSDAVDWVKFGSLQHKVEDFGNG